MYTVDISEALFVELGLHVVRGKRKKNSAKDSTAFCTR